MWNNIVVTKRKSKHFVLKCILSFLKNFKVHGFEKKSNLSPLYFSFSICRQHSSRKYK